MNGSGVLHGANCRDFTAGRRSLAEHAIADEDCRKKLGDVDELLADETYLEKWWNAEPDCRHFLFKAHVADYRRVEYAHGNNDPAVSCETHLVFLIQHLVTIVRVYDIIMALESFRSSASWNIVSGLLNYFTLTQCVYMWVSGVLGHMETQSPGYVFVCFPLLHEALIRMREQFINGLAVCGQTLYWHVALLMLVEPMICSLSRSNPDVSTFGAICRAAAPEWGLPVEAARLPDWLFLFGTHDLGVVAADGSPLLAHGASSAPVYSALQLRAERRAPRESLDGERASCAALMAALHGGNVFEELEEQVLPLNLSCPAGPDSEAGAQAFDPELIAQISDQLKPSVVIEVGVFTGRSSLEFARRADCVISVDTFLGDSYMWTTKRSQYLPRLSRIAGFPLLYFCFLRACNDAGLASKVVPVPQSSSHAFRVLDVLGVEADLIYIDAGHDVLDVLEDITHYWLLLRCGGRMFGDDYHWRGVRTAVDAFAEQQGLMVEVGGLHQTKWLLSQKRCSSTLIKDNT